MMRIDEEGAFFSCDAGVDNSFFSSILLRLTGWCVRVQVYASEWAASVQLCICAVYTSE